MASVMKVTHQEMENSFVSVTGELPVPHDFSTSCANFFGYENSPYSINPINEAVFHHHAFTKSKNDLLFSITSGERLTKLTGKNGVGKTLLVSNILSSIDHYYYSISILNSEITGMELLMQIIDEFGKPYPANASLEQLLRVLRLTLFEYYANNQANIIIWIDDAQLLSIDTMLIIKKITQWQTKENNLLQFLLSGNDQLDKNLEHRRLQSVKNKCRFSSYLNEMSKDELLQFLNTSTFSGAVSDQPQFMPTAIDKLYKYSKGNPEKINQLAYKALLLAYGKGLRTIRSNYIDQANQDNAVDSIQSSRISILKIISFIGICNIAMLIIISGSF